jgi:hypothetical protein
MVVDWDTGGLGPALAVVTTCYYYYACCRAVRPVTRRLAKKVQVVVAQDMYTDTDIAGSRESEAWATERTERRD